MRENSIWAPASYVEVLADLELKFQFRFFALHWAGLRWAGGNMGRMLKLKSPTLNPTPQNLSQTLHPKPQAPHPKTPPKP